MPTYAYDPNPPPLSQEELDALAAQQQAMGGYVPPGGYLADPVPPLPAETAPPPASAPVPSPGLGGGSYPVPASTEPVPPPPTPPPTAAASSWTPTLDFAAPVGAVKDAFAASPVGQSIGNVLATPLPGSENIPVPPPTAVGTYLGQGQPGPAAQIVGNVASSAAAHPIETASLLFGGPLARGALGIGRGLLAGGAARSAALSSLGTIAGAAPIAAPLLILKDFDPSRESAPTTTRPPATTAPSSTPASMTVPRPTSTLTAPTWSGSAGDTGTRPAASLPTTPAAQAPAPITATPAPPSPAPAVSAPAWSSSPSPSRTSDTFDLLRSAGLPVDAVELASDFSASDFEGNLGLPELRNISPAMARRMAGIANAKVRRRRGTRGFPFSVERGEFGRMIRESVFQALREAGITSATRS